MSDDLTMAPPPTLSAGLTLLAEEKKAAEARALILEKERDVLEKERDAALAEAERLRAFAIKAKQAEAIFERNLSREKRKRTFQSWSFFGASFLSSALASVGLCFLFLDNSGYLLNWISNFINQNHPIISFIFGIFGSIISDKIAEIILAGLLAFLGFSLSTLLSCIAVAAIGKILMTCLGFLWKAIEKPFKGQRAGKASLPDDAQVVVVPAPIDPKLLW